jgi:hypothetical protein
MTLLSFFVALNFTSANAKDLSQETGISTGEYLLERGPDSCLKGLLTYLDVDGTTGIKLGSRLLVQQADKSEFSYKERDCSFETKNKLLRPGISSVNLQKCKGTPDVERTTEIKPSKNGFIYKITVVESGKKISEDVCHLKRQQTK